MVCRSDRDLMKGLAVALLVVLTLCILPMPSLTVQASPLPGILGLWHFDEGRGTTAGDSSGYGNQGTIYGASWVDGKIGKALKFNGEDDYVNCGNAPSLILTDQITIEAWVKLSSLDGFQCLVGKSSYNNNGYRVFKDANNKVNFQVINAMDYLVISYDSIDANWHNVVATYDGYNGRIYLDGEEIWAYLPNDDLSPVTFHNDKFSDSNGNRVWPWGIEVWAGTPKSYFGGGEVRVIGNSATDAVVLAIPDYAFKPRVKEGLLYTQSFSVKYYDVQSPGVRLIHQWFDQNGVIIRTDYGNFEAGTADWHTISLTKQAPLGAVRGDIIVQLYGRGVMQVKEPKFYLTNVSDRQITPSDESLVLGKSTGNAWHFNGIIDAVCLRNVALTSEQIKANYELGTGTNIKVRPKLLNLMGNQRKGTEQWLTVYVEPPVDYSVNRINKDSIKLTIAGRDFPVDLKAQKGIGDYNKNGIPDLAVSFKKEEISSRLRAAGVRPGIYVATVAGFIDSFLFVGTDKITLKGKSGIGCRFPYQK